MNNLLGFTFSTSDVEVLIGCWIASLKSGEGFGAFSDSKTVRKKKESVEIRVASALAKLHHM